MNKQTPRELIDKYLSGRATAEEKATLESWYLMRAENIKDALPEPDYTRLEGELWPVIEAQTLPEQKQQRLWPRIIVAAAAVAAIVVGVWFYSLNRHAGTPSPTELISASQDIAPGKNGATITLANGKVIQLSDSKSGVVIGGEVKYSDGSDVRYSSGAQSPTPVELQGPQGKAQHLIAGTARGQTYQFTLPDGTKVWLNADSKLEFPSHFGNLKMRTVKLSGEAYFEVAKDKSHPFIVKTDRQEVEVLGTHFNINSYNDEGSVRTTLLEGSVRVAGYDGETVVLKPDQQSVVSRAKQIDVSSVDVGDVVAWKNGKFVFVRENVRSIMNKIARWYDVEIAYEGDVRGKALGGSVSRFKNVSEVLEMLSATRAVQFKIEGRKVIVMPFKE